MRMNVQAPNVGSMPLDHHSWIRQCLSEPGGLQALPQNQSAYFNLAVSTLEVGQLVEIAGSAPADDACALYGAWLRTHSESPFAAVVWFNFGTLLLAAGKAADAVGAFSAALKSRPDLHEASVNLGLALEACGRPEEALAAWNRALPPPPVRNLLHTHLGRLLETLGRLEEAEPQLRSALLIKPEQPDVQQHFVHMRQRMAVWPVLDATLGAPPVETQARNCGPLGALALYDDPVLQGEINTAWLTRKLTAPVEHLAPPEGYDHDRIRIGYLSTDFCRHAMSYLIAELLELHDRSAFEVFGYCASPEDGSDIRARVLAALDHVEIVGKMSDEEIARKIRADEIDILIDLNGLTKGARIGALRWKPAPVQATYLGYIGPIPLPELDWLIADAITIPPELDPLYSPRPLRLEGCYQANDGRAPNLVPVSRAEEGLPEDAFVFCCFSHHYKVTEEIFAAWVSILAGTENSVLWIVDDGPVSRRNFIERWAARGLAPERLIFAPRVDPDRYRSRMALADLFLDTTPYNAGTIASDALRMGLPLLTLQGKAFAARMASSILTAIGLDDCVTTDIDGYVGTAIRLARDPGAYRALRERLGGDAWMRTLGNAADFTQRFETAMKSIRKTPRG